MTAEVLVCGQGPLSEPRLPDVTGIELHVPGPAAPEQPERTYTYQAGSNRLDEIEEAGNPTVQLGYDARGNVTSYGGQSFSYDALGRLVEAKLNGDPVATYVYNYRNQRVKKATTAGAVITVKPPPFDSPHR